MLFIVFLYILDYLYDLDKSNTQPLSFSLGCPFNIYIYYTAYQ